MNNAAAVVVGCFDRYLRGGDHPIVWRPTDIATWTDEMDFGLVTRVTIRRVSQDKVVVGVQARSKRGHASLAPYPLRQARR